MTTTTQEQSKVVRDMQEQTLKAIEQAQDASVKLVSLMVDQWHQAPTPAQAIESGFAFAGRVLEIQKDYALRLAGALPTDAKY